MKKPLALVIVAVSMLASSATLAHTPHRRAHRGHHVSASDRVADPIDVVRKERNRLRKMRLTAMADGVVNRFEKRRLLRQWQRVSRAERRARIDISHSHWSKSGKRMDVRRAKRLQHRGFDRVSLRLLTPHLVFSQTYPSAG